MTRSMESSLVFGNIKVCNKTIPKWKLNASVPRLISTLVCPKCTASLKMTRSNYSTWHQRRFASYTYPQDACETDCMKIGNEHTRHIWCKLVTADFDSITSLEQLRKYSVQISNVKHWRECWARSRLAQCSIWTVKSTNHQVVPEKAIKYARWKQNPLNEATQPNLAKGWKFGDLSNHQQQRRGFECPCNNMTCTDLNNTFWDWNIYRRHEEMTHIEILFLQITVSILFYKQYTRNMALALQCTVTAMYINQWKNIYADKPRITWASGLPGKEFCANWLITSCFFQTLAKKVENWR